MKQFLLGALALSALVSVARADAPVYTRSFVSGGYKVSIQYTVQDIDLSSDKPHTIWTAISPTLTVENSDPNATTGVLQPSDKIEVILTNHLQHTLAEWAGGPNSYTYQEVYKLDLGFDSNHNAFSAGYSSALILNNGTYVPVPRVVPGTGVINGIVLDDQGYGYENKETGLQISVVVNGNWLKPTDGSKTDPSSGDFMTNL